MYPVVDTLHGMQLTDNFRWLEDKTNQKVIDWTRAQHDYGVKYLEATQTLHKGLREESNGGLLMGAVATQRPDLYKAILCGVPLLDMLRYHKFLIARYWIPEYGSADNEADFRWLLTYSPYHHIRYGIN